MYLIDIVFQDASNITPELSIAHREYLAPYYESHSLLFGGRKIPRTGGIILAQHLDENQIRDIMRQDPIVAKGFATFTITEFQVVMASENFRALIN